MLRLSATQKRYVATIATQTGYVAILCDRNVRATLRDPKQICCDFPGRVLRFLTRPTRPKNGKFRPSRPRRDLFRPTRSRLSMCRPYSTKEKCFDRVRPMIFFDREEFQPRKNLSTLFDREKTFRPSSTDKECFQPKKNNSTAFDARFSRLRRVSI